jgi:HD superfamily phosphohydrolase
VPYGSQDVDFILSRLFPDKERGTDIDSRLIPNVEAILFSKYLMYRTVYWHHQVRSATAMVKKVLINGLEAGQITGEELYNLDDTGLFSILWEKTGNPLVESVREGRIFATAAEIPHESLNLAAIREISRRAQLEEQFAEELRLNGLEIRGEELIIDIPEPASFETGLFVLDEKRSFGESSSAFTTETVNSFIKTLYTVRIFTDQKYKQKLKTFPHLSSILNKVTKRGA